MKRRTPLPQRRFVRHGGIYCPQCRSAEIEQGAPEHVHGALMQVKARCTACGADWTVFAEVTGYKLAAPLPAIVDELRRHRAAAKRRRTHTLLLAAGSTL
jgi:transposase-like protein